LHYAIHLNIKLPQGHAGTCLRYGEKYDVHFVENLIIFSLVKERKLINI